MSSCTPPWSGAPVELASVSGQGLQWDWPVYRKVGQLQGEGRTTQTVLLNTVGDKVSIDNQLTTVIIRGPLNHPIHPSPEG